MRFLKAKAVDLSPCPFCGGAAQIGTRDVEATLRLTGFRTGTVCWHFVGCHNPTCEIQPKVSRPHDRSQEAIDLWNARVQASHPEVKESWYRSACMVGDVIEFDHPMQFGSGDERVSFAPGCYIVVDAHAVQGVWRIVAKRVRIQEIEGVRYFAYDDCGRKIKFPQTFRAKVVAKMIRMFL